jgi:hypothetical protein
VQSYIAIHRGNIFFRHSIPEKVLADLFYVSVGSVDAILKTWCILINSVFMKLPISPTTEEFNSVCPEKLKKMFPRKIFFHRIKKPLATKIFIEAFL